MKTKVKQYLLLLASVFLASGVLTAQEEQSTFNLDQAISYAMQNSYVLQNSSRDVSIAQKQVWEAISTGLPQASGSANYNWFLNLPVSLIPGEFFGGEPGTYIPVKFGQDYNSDFGLSVNQMIFDGSYIVGIGSAQLYVDLAKQTYEKSEIDIREAVTQAYYMVLISIRYKEVMQESYDNTKKLYDETKIYFDNGLRESQDVDQLKILVKNAENEMLRSDRELEVARIVLKYTMGYPLDSTLQLTDKIESFVLPLVQDQNKYQLDLTGHIDYRLADYNFQLSEKLMKLEKVAYLPNLNGFYSYTRTAYGNNANLIKEKWFPSSLIGFQATIPIFNSGMKRSRVQQARLEMDKAAINKIQTERTLQRDFLTAKAEMETARERFLNDRENRDLAQSILEKSQIKFNNGMISSAELSQQESQYISAFQSMVTSTLQLLQADLSLKKAAGAL